MCTVRKESVTDEEGIFWVMRPPNLLACRCVVATAYLLKR